jgi:hypothetical protein
VPIDQLHFQKRKYCAKVVEMGRGGSIGGDLKERFFGFVQNTGMKNEE